MSNDYCNDITQALKQDAQQREIYRIYAPTPAERRERERAQVAYAFEHGDHQPDGTVLPPGMKYERTPTGCWLGKPVDEPKVNNVYDAAGLCGGKAVLNPVVNTAMAQMNAYFAKRVQERAMAARGCERGVMATGLGVGIGPNGNCDEERVSVQVFLRMPRIDAERLRERMASNPDMLRNMLGGLQLEAAYALDRVFDVMAEPLE